MIPQFNKVSTTSYVAIIVTIGVLAYCFALTFLPSVASETTETQIVQGMFGLLMLVAGYYFGMSKNRGQQGPTIDKAGEVNVTNQPPAE